jgi:hypothetical protein
MLRVVKAMPLSPAAPLTADATEAAAAADAAATTPYSSYGVWMHIRLVGND